MPCSRNTIKQFCAELPLEGRHCRRYRGRGKSEGIGRACYVFAFGNRDEDLQLVKCHAAVLRQALPCRRPRFAIAGGNREPSFRARPGAQAEPPSEQQGDEDEQSGS